MTKREVEISRILDATNLVLAVALFLSPWVLGYADAGMPAWNAWAFGIVIAAIATAALQSFARWEEMANLVAGLWVLAAPWALGFTHLREASWAHIAIGALVAVLAALELWMSRTPTFGARA